MQMAQWIQRIQNRGGKTPSKNYQEPLWYSVLGVSCILAGLLGLRVLSDSHLWKRWMDQITPPSILGTVTRQKGGVRLRPSEAFAWQDLADGAEPVGSGDTLFTNETGFAELRLENRPIVKLLPGTILVVQNQVISPKESGSWLNRIFMPLMGLKTESSTLKLEKGDIKIDFTNGKTVNLDLAGRNFEIAPAELLKDLKPGASAKPSVLELHADLDHAQTLLKQTTKSPLQMKELGTDLATQVRTLSQGEVAKVSASGNVAVDLASYRVISPQPNERLLLKTDVSQGPEREINFSWEWKIPAPPQSASLVIEGAVNRTIPIPDKARSLKVSLRAGDYRWRLATLSTQAKPEPWSDFSILRLAPPQIIWPADGHLISTTGKDSTSLTISWKPLVGHLLGEVEMKDSGDNTLKIRKSVKGSATSVELILKSGKYLWRARSASDSGFASAWSPYRRVSVVTRTLDQAAERQVLLLPSPVPIPTPQSQTDEQLRAEQLKKESLALAKSDPKLGTQFRLDSIQTEVRRTESGKLGSRFARVNWAPIKGATSYDFSLFKPSGELVLKQTVTLPKIEIQLGAEAAAGFNYEIKASNSEVSSGKTEFKPLLDSPLLKQPLSGSLHPALKNLYLTWTREEKEEWFQLQVSEDPDFKVVLVDEVLQKNLKSYAPPKEGTYYWRVRTRIHATESPWSAISLFTAKPLEQK